MLPEGSSAVLETPRGITLVAIAVVCGGLGFGLARTSLDVDRAAAATRADEARAAADATRTNDADEPAAIDLPTDASAETTAAPSVDAGAPAVVAEPAVVEPPSTTGAPATIIEGRVAYIRCEGLPNVPPSGPCPRDHSVEARVWEAIRALPTCAALAGREGSSDVRVVFDGARMSGLGFRDLPDELDREAVRSCLEPTLERVRTGLGTTRLTTSFRFELTP